MFGNYSRALDDKNRVIVPSKLRSQLGGVCYITLGPDNVLEVRDQNAFDTFRQKLLSPNMLNKNARRFARILLGNTHEADIDKAGRVSMPESFLKKTGITKNITFVGVGNKVEIWPTEAYEAFENEFKDEGSIEDLAKKLLEEGVEL